MILCRACARPTATSLCVCGEEQPLEHAELNTLSIAHLDCDAFYASIEKRDDPSLQPFPVIVGGGKRGVVSTCCYVARAYGVRSAMPMFKALQLCPQAKVVHGDMSKYVEEGRLIRHLMEDLTPQVQPLSIDEAFMDLTGTEALHGGSPAQSLIKLQNKIWDERRLTVSIGLSFNKFLAKTASDLDKPRGFSVIGRAEALTFLESRSVSTLPGVGPAGATALERNGLKKIGDIRTVGPQRMRALYGDWGAQLFSLSMADDPRKVDPDGERKSISAETTFFEDISDLEALEDILWPLCEKVATRCRASETAGLTLTLKLKDTKFKIITRRRQLPEPTLLASRIFAAARELLAGDANGRTKYRLIGVGLSDFSDAGGADKGDMLDTETPKRAAVEGAIAKARGKFGRDAVQTGRALKAQHDDE
ncbi:DNA polymerase IV [Terricaulis silvestris]|uniref:DNA polymerase IV n=1 Tax=Terricaulis silvestris TaxID=2686094 RepID=A0A6I6MSR4_9CAUL|nr:DNA polymerase IV [Terricaulis silvestris]QGZ94722.1 DNA polymerase IV [Terricaulis silvestris]